MTLLDEEEHEEEAKEGDGAKKPESPMDTHRRRQLVLESHRELQHADELGRHAEARCLIDSDFGDVDPGDGPRCNLENHNEDADSDER